MKGLGNRYVGGGPVHLLERSGCDGSKFEGVTLDKQVVIVSAIALSAASYIAYLVLAPGPAPGPIQCAAGTVPYESGPVKTCVPPNQTSFLACLGQVKSAFSKGEGDPGKGAFKVTVGELSFDLDIRGNKAVVPESSVTSDPTALAQVEKCGRQNGLTIERGVVNVDVVNSRDVGIVIDNSQKTQPSSPPTQAAAGSQQLP